MGIVIEFRIFILQWLTGYLGLALVFVWDGAQREAFSFYFSSVNKAFILAGGLGAGLSFYGV